MTPSRSRESRIRQAAKRHQGAMLNVLRTGLPLHHGRGALLVPPDEDTVWVEQTVRQISDADPTDCGTYTDWLTSQWIKGSWALEDAPRLHDDLLLFDRNRHRIPERDITRYRTPQDLLRAIRPYRTVSCGDTARDRPEMLEPPLARVIRDDADYHVVVPLTAEAAAYWGAGSEWCITWGVPGYRYSSRGGRFQQYASTDTLFIIRRHADASLWCLQVRGLCFPERTGGDRSASDLYITSEDVRRLMVAGPSFREGLDPQLWDADDRLQMQSLRELLSERWKGFLDERMVSLISPVFPALGDFLGVSDSVRNRRIELHYKPELVHHLPEVTRDERRRATERKPSVMLGLPAVTEAEMRRIIALNRSSWGRNRFPFFAFETMPRLSPPGSLVSYPDWAQQLREALLQTWHRDRYTILSETVEGKTTHRLVLGPRLFPSLVLQLTDGIGEDCASAEAADYAGRRMVAREINTEAAIRAEFSFRTVAAPSLPFWTAPKQRRAAVMMPSRS